MLLGRLLLPLLLLLLLLSLMLLWRRRRRRRWQRRLLPLLAAAAALRPRVHLGCQDSYQRLGDGALPVAMTAARVAGCNTGAELPSLVPRRPRGCQARPVPAAEQPPAPVQLAAGAVDGRVSAAPRQRCRAGLAQRQDRAPAQEPLRPAGQVRHPCAPSLSPTTIFRRAFSSVALQIGAWFRNPETEAMPAHRCQKLSATCICQAMC